MWIISTTAASTGCAGVDAAAGLAGQQHEGRAEPLAAEVGAVVDEVLHEREPAPQLGLEDPLGLGQVGGDRGVGGRELPADLFGLQRAIARTSQTSRMIGRPGPRVGPPPSALEPSAGRRRGEVAAPAPRLLFEPDLRRSPCRGRPPCTCRRPSGPRRATAVSASISTPVRPWTFTVASIRRVRSSTGVSASVDGVEPERVAERDQVARPLRRHDPGQPGDLEHVPLGDPPVEDQGQGRRLHPDQAARPRRPGRSPAWPRRPPSGSPRARRSASAPPSPLPASRIV